MHVYPPHPYVQYLSPDVNEHRSLVLPQLKDLVLPETTTTNQPASQPINQPTKTNKQTSKQANKETKKQKNKETNKQASKQTNKRTNERTNKQTNNNNSNNNNAKSQTETYMQKLARIWFVCINWPRCFGLKAPPLNHLRSPQGTTSPWVTGRPKRENEKWIEMLGLWWINIKKSSCVTYKKIKLYMFKRCCAPLIL